MDLRIKNKILIFICLFYAISSVKSQGFLLASDASIGTIDRNRYYNFSLNGEYFPSQRFSILYNLDYQMRASGEQSVHVWAGLPLMFFALIDPTLAVVAFIPDGMSYHIPITPKLDIAPYANVLGVDYVWDDKLGYTDLQYATSLGLKFSRWTGSNWIFQGFFETNKNYSLENFRWNRWGFQGGLGLAYNFNGSVDVGLPEYRPEMSNFLSPESSQGILLGTDASVGLIGGERYYNFSLNSEYFTGNRFSILHSLDYQMKSNGEKSVHIWGSSPLLLLSIIEPTWGVLGLVPDGMSYHIPVAPTMDISPYANVLGFDYVWNDNQKYLDVQYAMSFGLKTSYWTNFNLLVQAFFETKKNYSFENAGWNKWGFEGGIGLAYNIGGVDIYFPEPRIREPKIKVEQNPIELTRREDSPKNTLEEEYSICSKGSQPALTLNISNVNANVVREAWESFVKKFKGTTNYLKKDKEVFTDDAIIKEMSGNTVDIIARVDETDNGSKLTVWFNLGVTFLSQKEFPRQYAVALKILEEFSLSFKNSKDQNQECITKLDKIITYQAELEAGNLETAKKVKKELELLSYLSCYSEMNTEQKNRIEYLDQTAKKVIRDNEKPVNEKKYSDIGGLRWDNFNATETKDRDGHELIFAENIEKWIALCDSNEAAYCYYNFDKSNSKMGLIYNHAAVRVIAPEGKRVPRKVDFDTLIVSLGNSLCSIIAPSSCSSCSKCNELDYDKQLDYNYKPYGWLSVSKSGTVKWVENSMNMYFWTLESDKLNTTLSGLGLAQFKAASSIKTIKLSEINDIGTKPKNIKLEDFQYVEKYYGTFIRFVKE